MEQPTAKTVKEPAARTSESAEQNTTAEQNSAVDRAADLSEEVLKSVEAGQRAALEAVRKFVDALDEVLPAIGGHPSRRERVIDAVLDMADKLVATQYDFLRSVVRSADRWLKEPDTAKK